MSTRRAVAAGIAAVVAGLTACRAPVTTAPPRAALERALHELLARPELAGGRVGVCVADAATGARWLEHAADRGFAPASNLKLVTAAVALRTLGAEHRFATELWLHGRVDGGTLHGDLVLRGHGDPSFGSGVGGADAFAAFAAALRARGVERVAGRCVGDDRWLGREHLGLGWQWDYLDEDYAAPFGGLCCGGNVVVVSVRPGADEPVVNAKPDVLGAVRARVVQVAAGGATDVVAKRALGSDAIEVTGTIAADAKVRTFAVPVPDPARFAALVLRAELAAAGIEVAGGVAVAGADAAGAGADERAPGAAVVGPDAAEVGAGERQPGAAAASPRAVASGVAEGGAPELVARVVSAPLGELLRRMLGDSDNLHAEQLLRCAARVATGDGGTAASAAHAAAVLANAGVDPAGLVIADGSGLSRRNLVQPRQLVDLLVATWASPHRDTFVAALPLAGASGTLRNRFAAGPAQGRVRAKTGFIGRVVCLSGYVPRPGAGAPPLVFSVMLNDFVADDAAAKAAVDAFVQQLAAAVGW